jgi:hypothetical protein
MKKLLTLLIMMLTLVVSQAQSNVDLTGKTFQQLDEIPNSTTELYFKSKTQVDFIMTNIVSGKTYVDHCLGKATINGNLISITCSCDDKELYPDLLVDKFNYNSKSKTLISTKYKNTDGLWFSWNLK